MKLLLFILLAVKIFGGVVEVPSTIHDFGQISIKDGKQTCSFEVKNVSEQATAIYAVMTSCGCTNVDWTRTDIEPGQSGTITVTYDNDEGPYPFDKTVTAYVKNYDKPIVFHVRGKVGSKVNK